MSDLEYYYKKGKRDGRKCDRNVVDMGLVNIPKLSPEAKLLRERILDQYFQPPHKDVSNKNQRQEDEYNAYKEGWYDE